jgi:hypothetical protein
MPKRQGVNSVLSSQTISAPSDQTELNRSVESSLKLLDTLGNTKPQSRDRLYDEINVLKNPAAYREKYSVPAIQDLSQAIDIIAKLQGAAYGDASRIGYDKLKHAKYHLEKLVAQALEG